MISNRLHNGVYITIYFYATFFRYFYYFFEILFLQLCKILRRKFQIPTNLYSVVNLLLRKINFEVNNNDYDE